METAVEILRLEQTHQGTIGVLLFLGELFCNTLEPNPGNIHRFLIPEGVYYTERRIKPEAKFPDTFELYVPGHTSVLYHWGNVLQDTKGCIILGYNAPWQREYRGTRAIFSSKKTFDIFMEKLSNTPKFYTKITERR